MGVFKMFSSSSNEDKKIGPLSNLLEGSSEEININPNPFNFKIIKKSIIKNDMIVLWVNYPNCKNFEGNKIIVLSKDDYLTVKKTNKLDPHFSSVGQTVIARFQPTETGWNQALEFIKLF